MLKPKDMPATVHLDSKTLPDIRNWEVGKTYTVELKIRQTSYIAEEDNRVSAGFEIVSVKAEDGNYNTEPSKPERKNNLSSLQKRAQS